MKKYNPYLYIGMKFNKLLVEKFLNKEECNKNGIWFQCKCDCGNSKITSVYQLLDSNVQSCGCLNKKLASARRISNLVGRKFGKLEVIKKHQAINGKVTWECKCECGNLTYPTTSNLTKSYKPTKSCGCILRLKGKDHFNWDDTIPLEDKLNRRGTVKNPKYDEWVKSVFTRDKYTCQITGQIGTKLCSHHIYSWNKYVNRRYDLDNGITLSEKIHKLFHKIYGNGNNTKEQFEEFTIDYKKGKYANCFK